MSDPQQPELAHGQVPPGADGPAGPVPVDNQLGHHPSKEQDKPDLDAFAAKLGIVEEPDRNDSAPKETAARRVAPAAVAGVVAGVLTALLGVLALRRRRARR